jgi:DNA-binding NarL/FixJ family response regulator
MRANSAFVASPATDSRLDSWLALMRVTPQEQRVVLLVERGLTNPEIAELLGVSRHTIRNQVASVFSKLQVSRRAELVYLLGRVLGGEV